MAEDGSKKDKPGLRKDGKPFAPGNTREDGSYATGKNRPPENGQFRTGDNRKRGTRPKGVKNHATIWREEFDRPVVSKNPVTGAKETLTSYRATARKSIERAILKSDRAAEFVMRQAEKIEEKAPQTMRASDREILDQWLARKIGEADRPIVSDDHDLPGTDDEEDDNDEGDPDDVDQ